MKRIGLGIPFFLVTFFLFSETLVFDPFNSQNLWSSSRAGVYLDSAGRRTLGLADTQYEFTDETDLLLHFNSTGNSIYQGDYQLLASDVLLQEELRALGNGAGLFTEMSRGMVLEPGRESMFQPGTHVGAFTIEFWLYTASPKEGATVLAWQGSSWTGSEPLFQLVSARVVNRRLVWQLENFFVRGDSDTEDPGFIGLPVRIGQRRDLVPRRWTHHLLRFDPQRSILEYLVDGLTEDIQYITHNGTQGGDPFIPYVGELSEPALSLGYNLNGVLDEFRVSRRWVEEPVERGVSQVSGYVQFARQDLYYPGAQIVAIDQALSEPGLTEVRTSWILSDFIEQPHPADPRWRLANDTQGFREDRGRYLYLMSEFLPDGIGTNRPGVREIRITYNEELPPPAPTRVRAESVEDGIELTWDRVIRGNPEGYIVYFGERPNEYFGESAVLGASPLDVGDRTHIKITGLDPGRVYYFRVGSYNYSNNPLRGEHIPLRFSAEVAARPIR